MCKASQNLEVSVQALSNPAFRKLASSQTVQNERVVGEGNILVFKSLVPLSLMAGSSLALLNPWLVKDGNSQSARSGSYVHIHSHAFWNHVFIHHLYSPMHVHEQLHGKEGIKRNYIQELSIA